MYKKKWNPHLSVIVCGVENGKITSNGDGCQTFNSLIEAQTVFSDLDPYKNTKRFTWATGDRENDMMRFDTWEAERIYSM